MLSLKSRTGQWTAKIVVKVADCQKRWPRHVPVAAPTGDRDLEISSWSRDLSTNDGGWRLWSVKIQHVSVCSKKFNMLPYLGTQLIFLF